MTTPTSCDSTAASPSMNILEWETFQKPINRAVWAEPLGSEAGAGAPDRRIIHSRMYSAAESVMLKRIGIRVGTGYFKCGGEELSDWVSSLRVLVYEQGGWQEIRWFRDLQRPEQDEVVWLDDLNLSTQAFILEVRASGVDGWWTPWDLAMTGLVLETEVVKTPTLRLDLLDIASVEGFGDAKVGLGSCVKGDTVVYRFEDYEVGFNLRHPSFSHFRMRGLMPEVELQNQLRASSHFFIQPEQMHMAHLAGQGPRFWLVGGDAEAGYAAATMQGTCKVEGNTVSYAVRYPDSGIELNLVWTMAAEGMTLEVERTVPEARHALFDSVWATVFDSKVTPVSTLGEAVKQGETGHVQTPFLLHSPRGGNFMLEQSGTPGTWRYDSIRPLHVTSAEWQVGHSSQANGTYLLEAGTQRNRLEWQLSSANRDISEAAPQSVQDAVARCLPTAFAYRPDASTLSNNSTSIHCYFCLEFWISLTKEFPEVHGLPTEAFLNETLTRWLTGAPSYASGASPDVDHLLDEEYTHSMSSPMYALSEYLLMPGHEDWEGAMMKYIMQKLELLESLDVDGDGLIVSRHRRGISGEHQWSSNWWDVISFGWKDAFVNASTYPMLLNFGKVFERRGESELADKMNAWAARLKQSYHQTFWNPDTGWYGGWRDKGGVLHDYGFLFVNGAAAHYGLVPDELLKPMMRSLYEELEAMKPPYHLGLPGNLRLIPDADLAEIMHGRPYGWYQNGGLTHSQSKHFLGGLYAAGLTAEGDALLEKMAPGLGEGEVFAGLETGVDWRLWNGSPTGYEGVLDDQFGLLAVMKHRWPS